MKPTFQDTFEFFRQLYLRFAYNYQPIDLSKIKDIGLHFINLEKAIDSLPSLDVLKKNNKVPGAVQSGTCQFCAKYNLIEKFRLGEKTTDEDHLNDAFRIMKTYVLYN